MSQSQPRFFWFVTAVLVVVMLLSSEAAISIFLIDGPRLLALYLVYLSAASVLIGALIFAIDRWYPTIFITALSLGFAFLILSLRLNFSDVILGLSIEAYLILFLCLWSVLGLALWAGMTGNRVPKLGLIAATVAVLSAPMFIALGVFIAEVSRPGRFEHKIDARVTHALPPSWEKLRFDERPNIYLLSFDSLIPADVAAAYLQISRPDYYRLTAGLLRELPNSLVFKVPSMNSLNALMSFDQNKSTVTMQNAFTGGSSSYLGEVARLNGYKLVTGWPGYVPNWMRGDGVDRLIYPLLSENGDENFLCDGADFSRKIKIRGLFFCPFLMQVGSAVRGPGGELEPFRDTALKAAIAVAGVAQPTIFFTYVYYPIGHTSHDFDFRSLEQFVAYRDQFLAQSILAADFIERSVVSIRSVDPSSIIVIFGDHGAYLSRAINPSADPKFVYSDRHRVFLAVASGGHHCGKPEQVHSGGIYNTPSRILLDIMICLSGGVTGVTVDFDEDPLLVRQVFQ